MCRSLWAFGGVKTDTNSTYLKQYKVAAYPGQCVEVEDDANESGTEVAEPPEAGGAT